MRRSIIAVVAVVNAVCLFAVVSWTSRNLSARPRNELVDIRHSTAASPSQAHDAVEMDPQVATDISSSPRAVFLAGPHKTGTTSVQYNLMTWYRSGRLGDWVWAAPKGISSSTEVGNVLERRKAFAPLINYLAGNDQKYPKTTKRYKKDEILDLYRRKFDEVWKSGKNILFATEAGDFVLRDGVDGNKLIDGILSMMPWSGNTALHTGSNDKITVVVTHRTPRVDHFISGWHQTGKGMAMREWVLHLENMPCYLDPLGMAEMYANHNVSIVIMDMSGMRRDGVDISNVVACEVLGVPCTRDGSIIGEEQPQIMNKKETPNMDLTPSELSQIDAILKSFDCNNYHRLVRREKVEILHGHELLKTLSTCSSNSTYISRTDLMKSIKSVVQAYQNESDT